MRAIWAVLATVAALAAFPAAAHDFWIQPTTFRSSDPAEIPLRLLAGHGADRQRSSIPGRRITRFEAIAPDGERTDLRPGLRRDGAEADARADLASPGVHRLVLATDSGAQSRLPAARFNAYLEEEGLTPALELRRQTDRMDAEGAEIYSRRAVALIRIGDGPPMDLEPLGLTLEIVPERDPFVDGEGAPLPLQILYQGQPLPGARVKLTDLDDDARPTAVAVTDGDGRARFDLPRSGSWLFNVVWTRPLPEGGVADFETVFSSLSLGFGD